MILNVSGVNARVLYQLSPTGKELTRIDFLKTLAKELCRPHVVTRISNPKISLKLRNLAADIFDFEFSHPLEPQPRVGTSKRKRCAICPSKKDRKTNTFCSMCKKPICKECAINVCPLCKNTK